MSFLTITPYTKIGNTINADILTSEGIKKEGTKVTQSIYDAFQNTIITLNVIDTPKVTRNLTKNKIKTFNTGIGNEAGYVYYNSGDAGFSFKVKCLISKKDILKDNNTVFHYLNYYFTNNIQVSVVMDTELVPNGIYDITDFSEYSPIRKDYYEIEIEFTNYVDISAKLTNKCTVLQSYLKQCKRPTSKVYTTKQIDAAKKGKPIKVKVKTKDKKGKTVTKTKTIKPEASMCIGYVNEVLYTLGFYGPSKPKSISGRSVIKFSEIEKYEKQLQNWKNGKKYYKNYKSYWTKTSVKGLKKFQKRWNKKGLKPKLNVKGTLDKNTWKAILRYPEVK